MTGRGSGRPSGRGAKVRVKTSARRRPSSTRWLERQLNDPYVAEARRLGYRSRAAFKLIQLDDRFHILGAGKRVVDLGAAPGGWSQVAVARVGPAGKQPGRVVAADILPMEAVPGAIMLQLDCSITEASGIIKSALGGPADVVLSDMAPSATGHGPTDHIRILALAEAAHETAGELLANGGAFVVKVWEGGASGELLARLKRDFKSVRHVKPAASRSDSAELFLVAQGFRRGPAT